MVTTRRSSENVNTYDKSSSRGGVDLLERPASFSAPVNSALAQTDSQSEAKERMQRNLDRLMNYDRYAEQQAEIQPEVDMVEDVLADEDIRPTSTTMQFGQDIDQIREEMSAIQDSEEEMGYHLNSKGRLAVILYSLAVTIILALIVLNTGVLASLSNVSNEKSAELSAAIERYDAVKSQIDDISSSDYIIDVAENQYGMVRQ